MRLGALWAIRIFAVLFNLMIGVVVVSGHARIWDAAFNPRWNGVPFVLRGSVLWILFLGPVLNTVAIFWRGR